VALKPGSEKADLTLPEDYQHDHPTEHPEDWGWHGEWGRASRVGGWVVIVILLVMMTSTHYNLQGALFLGLMAIGLFVVLLWDRNRRKNSWRQ
jgi:hypothetical protein